jgi:hypothetical protein
MPKKISTKIIFTVVENPDFMAQKAINADNAYFLH